ncbi:hypothetical protein BDW02DRAFT_298438 [Decorospora gaudefroyi]|uniref:Uncharacterized protein n=1 Tax=Decorospora gaudefroyi TaxID=184978 RepID=A0A6A5KG08_9PLEO|nr:hypothetical protein BDW02DRAFT_298438 [Decorospora gaudefroyi]
MVRRCLPYIDAGCPQPAISSLISSHPTYPPHHHTSYRSRLPEIFHHLPVLPKYTYNHILSSENTTVMARTIKQEPTFRYNLRTLAQRRQLVRAVEEQMTLRARAGPLPSPRIQQSKNNGLNPRVSDGHQRALNPTPEEHEAARIASLHNKRPLPEHKKKGQCQCRLCKYPPCC